jgi:hypothetical protein
MRESQRFMDEARKCFEQAAREKDPAQMKLYAELGQQFLIRAQEVLMQEKKTGNGNGNHG